MTTTMTNHQVCIVLEWIWNARAKKETTREFTMHIWKKSEVMFATDGFMMSLWRFPKDNISSDAEDIKNLENGAYNLEVMEKDLVNLEKFEATGKAPDEEDATQKATSKQFQIRCERTYIAVPSFSLQPNFLKRAMGKFEYCKVSFDQKLMDIELDFNRDHNLGTFHSYIMGWPQNEKIARKQAGYIDLQPIKDNILSKKEE